MTQPKLLTIAIPTYNRAACLDLCLKSIFSGLSDAHRSRLEVMVFDNCSPDDTELVVRRIQEEYPEVQYARHAENLGAERNLIAGFQGATARYVQILGDDDLWLPGRLPQLLDLLGQQRELGVVIMKAATFVDDPREALRKKSKRSYWIFQDSNHFLFRVAVNTTGISGSVINKQLIQGAISSEAFVGSLFVQLSWTIPAALKAQENVFIEQRMLAYKRANTGGYRLFHVFGENLVGLFNRFLDRGLKPIVVRKLRADLQHRVFPERLKALQSGNLERFDTRGALHDLDRMFQGDRLYPITLRSLVTSGKAESYFHKIVRKHLGAWHLRFLSCMRGPERSQRRVFPQEAERQAWAFLESSSS